MLVITAVAIYRPTSCNTLPVLPTMTAIIAVAIHQPCHPWRYLAILARPAMVADDARHHCYCHSSAMPRQAAKRAAAKKAEADKKKDDEALLGRDAMPVITAIKRNTAPCHSCL